MKTLNETVKMRKLKREDIKNILRAIRDAHSSSENINFDFERIGFDDDLRLTTFESTRENTDFHFELSKFLVKLLRFIDIEEKDTMNLGYSLFVKSSKENYRLEDLLETVGVA